MTVLVDAPISADQEERLKPYVPRLLIEWLREAPEARYRSVEGSLVFVDISGFTALTERLARKGKIGAELMRDTLDGVFTALLDEAYDWGAGLLKWGGDALLLLFDGPEHPERAARATWEMQRTIDRVGRLRVAGATVTLRMSVGLATGRIDFFTAGSVHRELLVAGPTATETVTIEAIADAGEIGVSAALASILRSPCVERSERGLFLCAPPDVERRRAPDVGAVNGLDVASCIPVAARAHVLLERSEPEHRTITAAFIDLLETDELLVRLGPEGFAEAVDARITTIQQAALRHDVAFYETDIGKGSIKALLTAGAPAATGHDEEQMLRTLREIIETAGVIPIRIGVNTGKVFTGDFGPPYRRAYRIFGDAINTAARVMSRAEPGQVLATDVVLERSRTMFETIPIEPFRAKGKAEPVRASVVGPIVGRRGERTAETPLVGRDAELAAVLAVLDDVCEGASWTVEISGAAGIGRSRLVHEVVAQRPDVMALWARCEEYEVSTPYYALRDPLRALLGLDPDADPGEAERRLRITAVRSDPTLAPWVPLLAILLGLDLAATAETARLDERFVAETLADVTERLFAAIRGRSPTILVVEDAQFMDEASAELLRRLGHSTVFPHALIVTHATPATMWASFADGADSCLALTLLPLSVRHLAEIVGIATDDRPLSPHDVDELARRADGNALFLFELLDAVRATGTASALPDSVEAVIAADIDRLSPSDRTVLRYASVLGVRFDPLQLARALHGETELDETLWGRLRGLVDTDTAGGMRFRNLLVRDVAYEGLPFRRRRELHERVASGIEQSAVAGSGEEELPALALHFFEAQRYDKAWRYCRRAGDRARSIAASTEAARFYERALAAARRLRGIDPRERAMVWISLGAARGTAGRAAESLDALRRATRLLAGDPVAQASVYAKRALIHMHVGAYGLGLRETAIGLRSLTQLEGLDAVAARATLRALRAELLWHQGNARKAIALALAAAADAEQSDDLNALAIAYTALDGSFQLLGEPEKAVYERKAVGIWANLGLMRPLGISELNLGVQAYADGNWDEAIDWYTRARDDCLRAGDRATAAMANGNLGEVLVSRGELHEAELVLTEARRALRAAGYTPHALFAEMQRARIALERGETTRALSALESIVAESATIGHPVVALETVVQLAHAYAVVGDPSSGLTALDKATNEVGEIDPLLAVPVDRARAECLIPLGRYDEAEGCLDRAQAGAVRQRLLYEQLLILRVRLDLARSRGLDPSREEVLEIERLRHLLGLGEGRYPLPPRSPSTSV